MLDTRIFSYTRWIDRKVSWFNNSKGYGFIGREDDADLFVHYSGIMAEGYKALDEGDKVEFDVVWGPSGQRQAAGEVRLAERRAA